MSEISIHPATALDVPTIHAMVRELAEYEHLLDAVEATEGDLRDALFGPRPVAEALVAALDGRPVGFVLFFHNYSTFVGRPGIYLEDLFVRPAARGYGVGKALMLRVIQVARERQCGRVEWAALKWNSAAIRFYESLGAKAMEEWQLFRLTREGVEGP
jgi:GNAT superfamily N-acetyltransferase